MVTYFWFLSTTFFNQNLALGTRKVCFTTLLKYIAVTKINPTLWRATALAFSVCLWRFDKAQPSRATNFSWKALNNPLVWRRQQEKCLKTKPAKKDASEDQYCYFFHPSTSKFVICHSSVWTERMLAYKAVINSIYREACEGFLLIYRIFYLQLVLYHTSGPSKIPVLHQASSSLKCNTSRCTAEKSAYKILLLNLGRREGTLRQCSSASETSSHNYFSLIVFSFKDTRLSGLIKNVSLSTKMQTSAIIYTLYRKTMTMP